ncbi:putative LRR receptor-like serine/threonine-protein kinase [Dichanthelium oligosanthes]|uniref:Putative LRR receptor-like serine/threonine-protein kinase n=1 Tax=Dichanthelium oligosanthes TaxID=888268 RepID=A0A1E5VRB9_9POAL|nr:putative LRR receptor-like serine/threonine-protein kinase [Dichanthelium oligosanthes]
MISSCSHLRIVDLLGNSLEGEIPPSLAQCSVLEQIILSNNNIQGSISSRFALLPNLSTLFLPSNKLTGTIPTLLGSCKSLTWLNLQNNSLRGGIPPGEIPSTLGGCVLLDPLHLEANFLNGSIPRSFISLRGINKMDLSQNNMSGEIPEFFRSFSSLQILNLSFNDFEGPVHQGGVFANSSAVFIKGNKMLCANSPMLQVPLCTASAPRRKKTSYIVAVVVPLTTIAIVAMACIAVTILKKQKETNQPTNQSFKQFKIFSYDDIFKATDGFSSACLVGSGRFGLVYRGQFDFEENPVAIKVFKLDQFGASDNFHAECEALRNIRHRNLIRVISLCSTFDTTRNEFKALILEYMANGNLESWIHPKGYEQSTKEPLSLRSRITVAVDIASALDYS